MDMFHPDEVETSVETEVSSLVFNVRHCVENLWIKINNSTLRCNDIKKHEKFL